MSARPLAVQATPPRALALVLTLGVHLVLTLLWLADHARAPYAPGAAQRVAMLMQIPRKATPAPLLPVSPSGPVRVPQRPQLPAALPVQANPVADTTPVAAPQPLPPGDESERAAPSLRERALRDVTAIGRELRPAGPAATGDEPPRLRLARLMAGARSGHLWGADVERRVSPDGVAITRMTRNGKTVCYMNGTVNFVPGILHDAARPQTVHCPPDDGGWSRD